ncbi:MAG: acetylornithine deacetylase [SAR324 cluster bacterium]|nr:acetylornithine deacetylase [SAR324 cluster bacterium]
MALDLITLERQLIAFDTVSRNSNLNMVDCLAEHMKGLGMAVEVYASADGVKANVFGTLGAVDTPGLMLAGHMDVVPVEGQAWETDPFTLTEADGRFYGRGTADMKSFIVLALLAAEAVRHRSLKLPLHLVFTYDEEVGCHGAARLMDTLQREKHVMPKCAVVGEPTNFQVFRMHKGFNTAKVTVRGVEGHSSKPAKGANAIFRAAQVVTKLMEVAGERQGVTSMEEFFEIPHTTLNVGMVNGGTAINIIPNHAEVVFEYRTMPGEDPDYVINQLRGYVSEVLLPDFRKEQPNVDIRVEMTGQGKPMMTAVGAEIETIALELTGNPRSTAAPYYTEGALYNDAGIPTVICGPGDIDQAHLPNEYVTAGQLTKGVDFLGRLIERVCL